MFAVDFRLLKNCTIYVNLKLLTLSRNIEPKVGNNRIN